MLIKSSSMTIMWLLTLCYLCFEAVNSFTTNAPENRTYKYVHIGSAMIKHNVVPDIIPVAPGTQIKVLYITGAKAYLGNILRPFKVKDEPTITWAGVDPDVLYTLIMIDPDGENQRRIPDKELKHWLVINIPGQMINLGQTISRYIGPGPLPHSGFHRYIILVYRQKSELILNEPHYDSDHEDRGNFSIRHFTEKYDLGDPVAGNFFRSLYVNDNYETELYKRMKPKKY